MVKLPANDGNELKTGKKYKFKSLRVYSSTEWMANATKKYRLVFDRDEVDYVRAEFAFYNKLFDENDWEATLRLKCYQNKGGSRKDLCDQSETKTIKADQNIVYFHKGWGTDKFGGFWRKGKYYWEAYINDELVGTKEFYIEEVGKVTAENNPYFEIESIKLFAGPYDGWAITNRKYLKKFNRETTQYLWVEVKMRNKVNSEWHCELFINHYDHAGQPKAQIVSFLRIDRSSRDHIYTFDEGWGSKEGGTWRDDSYTVEIVFMDTLLAIVPFEVGNEDVEGDIPVIKSNHTMILQSQTQMNEIKTDEKEETLELVLKELDELIGLQEIKQSATISAISILLKYGRKKDLRIKTQ